MIDETTLSLIHYATARKTVRMTAFWADRGLLSTLESNQAEIMCRADALIDGLEMLVPNTTEAQLAHIRECISNVRRVAAAAHGAFILEEQRIDDLAR
jgi:hypothetical protein